MKRVVSCTAMFLYKCACTIVQCTIVQCASNKLNCYERIVIALNCRDSQCHGRSQAIHMTANPLGTERKFVWNGVSTATFDSIWRFPPQCMTRLFHNQGHHGWPTEGCLWQSQMSNKKAWLKNQGGARSKDQPCWKQGPVVGRPRHLPEWHCCDNTSLLWTSWSIAGGDHQAIRGPARPVAKSLNWTKHLNRSLLIVSLIKRVLQMVLFCYCGFNSEPAGHGQS